MNINWTNVFELSIWGIINIGIWEGMKYILIIMKEYNVKKGDVKGCGEEDFTVETHDEHWKCGEFQQYHGEIWYCHNCDITGITDVEGKDGKS